MMREILFRGKDINTNKWCYGGYVRKVLFKNTKDEKIRHYIFDGENAGPIVMHEVNPETVGQCTRLEDYSGKYKAYEGDIVQDLDDGTLGIVYWDEKEAGFMIEIENCTVPAQDISYYQVIGNKWDNPELLEQLERQKENTEGEWKPFKE